MGKCKKKRKSRRTASSSALTIFPKIRFRSKPFKTILSDSAHQSYFLEFCKLKK